jgi:hypothetical protein
MFRFKRNKFKNIKTGGKDSKKESKRGLVLKQLEKEDKIKDLQEQVRFELQPSFRNKQGKAIRKMEYVPDFVYFDCEKELIVVEDVKGFKTPDYRLKAKLFQFKYPQYYFLET